MRLVTAAICSLLLTLSAFAQSDRGSITGTVTDPAKAVIQGAVVTATNKATGSEHKTVTTETGNYTISSLPAGVYDLSIEAPGFKKLVANGIQVQIANTTRMDGGLEVGATSESVAVVGESTLLQTENAEQKTNISGQMFNALPLNFGQTFGGSIRNW